MECFKQLIEILFPESFEKNYKVDFAWDDKETLDRDILEIAQYRYLWGQEVSEPLVVINTVLEEQNIALMGKGTLKISIPGTKTTCIKFGYGEEKYFNLMSAFKNSTGIRVEIVGYCRENVWNGNVSPQIEIQDFQVNKILKWNF